MLSITFSGCTKTANNIQDNINPPATNNVVSNNNNTYTTVQQTTDDGSFGSIDDVMNSQYATTCPLYILHEGRFYPIQKSEMYIGNVIYYFNDSPWYCATRLPQSELPVIDISAGDQLICISATQASYPIYNMTYQSYCLPVIWYLGQPIAVLAGMNGIIQTVGGNGIDDISGQPIIRYDTGWLGTNDNSSQAAESFQTAINNLGISTIDVGTNKQYPYGDYYVMVGQQNQQISVGQYLGTVYNQQSYSFDALLYSLTKSGDLPVDRTHNGYFIIDLSQYASMPGTYAISDMPYGIVIKN